MKHNLRASNLEFLAGRFGALAERIEAHQIYPGELRPTLTMCESGVHTASVSVRRRDVFLHSRYDPVREAKRWAAAQTPPAGAVVLILGWGLGYHVLEWVKAHGGKVEAVIVFEPEPELFKTSLFCVDLRPLGEAKRLEVIIGCDERAFERSMQNLIEPLLACDLSLLPLPFMDVYSPAIFEFLKKNLQALQQRREGILRYMEETGARRQEQIIRNIPAAVESFSPSEVKGLAAGQPGIIVAAGPSLDRNLEDLAEAQGSAWIFAVDTSLSTLMEHGIDAPFAVVKDPTELNRSHFEGLPDRPLPGLIFDPQISPDICARFTGPKICMPNRNHDWRRYIEGLPLSGDDALPHSTNVALAAFNMAVLMGCDPIVFAGLDLCFAREEGPSHAAGGALRSETFYEPDQRTLTYRRGDAQDVIQAIEVEGVDGGRYPTSPNFYESLRLLERLIQDAPARCIDASEGGVRIRGTESMTLREAIRTFCTKPIDAGAFFERERPERNRTKIQKDLIAVAEHIEHCGQTARCALRELEEGAALDHARKARGEIEEGHRLYHELQTALERLLVEISRPSFWDAPPDQADEQRRRCRAYFERIEQACAHFAPIYRQSARRVNL
ncbi:MAG: DUF115 domain-containing protein [Candidatus Omnitrophica bacterium]|nr:DUF115 domain-containing protein [Candidatus Omnitrophota bacterium]